MKYYCSNCKGPIKEGDKTCPKCGEELVWKKQYSQETKKPESRKEKIVELSPGQKRFLKQEIPRWKEKNIISEAQSIGILKEYGIKYQPEEKPKPIPKKPVQKKKPLDLVKVISTIGAIILGLGIILFAATNWFKIPNIIRMIILLITTAGVFYLGYHFSYKRKNYPILGKALLFLSTLCYGGSVFLIAQIYNVPANSHWLILIWAFSILPIAYFLSSTPVFILSSFLFIVWDGLFNTILKMPNYYYPLIIFLIMIPLAKNMKAKYIPNLVGLFIAQIYVLSNYYHWVALLWAGGALVYYFIYKKQSYLKKMYLIIATTLFVVWNVAFYLAFEQLPNYFYILPFIGLSYLAYKNRSFLTDMINIVGFFIWAPLFMQRFSAVLQFEKFFSWTLLRSFNWAILLWSICLLVFYFIYKKQALAILSSILFISWNITFFFAYEYFPSYFYILPLGTMLYLGYKNKSSTNICINTFGFIIWVNLLVITLSEIFFIGEFNLILFLLLQLLIGVLLYIIGVYHHNRELIKPFTAIFKIFGYLLILITINVLSLKFILEEFAKEDFQLYFFTSIVFIVLPMILIIVNSVKGFFASRSSKYELFILVFIILSAVFILIKPELLLANTIIFNALVFTIAFVTILFGFDIKRPVIFNIGIAIFILFIISRYFNVFWELLPRSIFFMIGGLLLILGGVFLERKRRKTVTKMKN